MYAFAGNPACYTLSRLKGIETETITILQGVKEEATLAIHFPV